MRSAQTDASGSVAFEPASLTFQYLRRNVRENGLDSLIETHQLGVGRAAGSAMLTVGWGRSAQGNLRIRCARQAGHRKVANDNRFARDGAPSTPPLGSVILAPTNHSSRSAVCESR